LGWRTREIKYFHRARNQAKIPDGVVHTLDETFMNAASQKVLDTLNIRFANFGEKIEKLSGGQRQAVAIARSVYWQAKLMIMDEPTNGSAWAPGRTNRENPMPGAKTMQNFTKIRVRMNSPGVAPAR
jgi:ABC-type phosphate transport system ATPase subunit